jgi:hypothetical protein
MGDEKKNVTKGNPGLEGEGSYSGAKKYDEEAEKFAREEDIDAIGHKALSEVEADEPAYRQAEEEGKKHAAEEDPELRK